MLYAGLAKPKNTPKTFPAVSLAHPLQASCRDGIPDGIGEQNLEPIPSNGTDRSYREKRPT